MSRDDPGPSVAFEVGSDGIVLRGEQEGEGLPVVGLHGLTATRRYVVHGSRTIPRRGYRLVLYDARGHGESDPAPAGEGYEYADLVSDLAAVLAERAGGPAVLVGHSMGAHTAIAFALERPELCAGLVLVGPAWHGVPLGEEALEHWDTLAGGLEEGGVDGFLHVFDRGLDPAWRATLLRITRDRLAAHRHPEAVARALREVPRSAPFESLDELASLDVPALVVGSRDEADPTHPLGVAERWVDAIPGARLAVEDEESSPLAWQGGRLSREVLAFCGEEQVRARLQ